MNEQWNKFWYHQRMQSRNDDEQQALLLAQISPLPFQWIEVSWKPTRVSTKSRGSKNRPETKSGSIQPWQLRKLKKAIEKFIMILILIANQILILMRWMELCLFFAWSFLILDINSKRIHSTTERRRILKMLTAHKY